MRSSRAALVLVPALALVVGERRAEAIEHQHHLGLSPSLSMLKIDDKPSLSVGAGAAIHYTYGLNDQWNFLTMANVSIVAAEEKLDTPKTPHTRPTEVDHVSAGIGYVIDILRWVPHVDATTGVYRLSGGTIDGSLFVWGVALGLGLDYQLSRHWAVGVFGQQHLLLTKMSTYPSYTNVLLRFEYMWGF